MRRPKRARGRRLAVNLALTALALVTGIIIVRPLAIRGAAWAADHSFGLLHLLGLPGWARVSAGVLLMDFTFYHWHRLNHTRPLLWRFHNIHHVDPDLDVSTSFRFHFGEILYSVVFRLFQVGVIGVLPLTYLIYEVIFNSATMFHHSNVRLPLRWERRLNRIFVTPRMHGVHHSVVARETNANYSVVFSWWDRLHRSLRLNVPQAEVIIGVPGYLLPRDNQVFPLLQFPFRRQRRYWRFPSGKTPVRLQPDPAPQPGLMLE